MQSLTKLAITGSIIASICCVMLTAEEEGRTLTNEDLISYSYHPDTKGDGTASDWEESNQYKSDHASDGRYDGNGDKKVSTINTPMKTVHRIGTYNHTVIEGGTIIRKYTGGRDEEKARAGQYAKSADDYFTSPVDEEGLPAVDQQQQIDAWKARHAGGTAYRGDGEKVEIEVRLPTRVVYTKPAPPPPPPGGGGGGDTEPEDGESPSFKIYCPSSNTGGNKSIDGKYEILCMFGVKGWLQHVWIRKSGDEWIKKHYPFYESVSVGNYDAKIHQNEIPYERSSAYVQFSKNK